MSVRRTTFAVDFHRVTVAGAVLETTTQFDVTELEVRYPGGVVPLHSTARYVTRALKSNTDGAANAVARAASCRLTEAEALSLANALAGRTPRRASAYLTFAEALLSPSVLDRLAVAATSYRGEHHEVSED